MGEEPYQIAKLLALRPAGDSATNMICVGADHSGVVIHRDKRRILKHLQVQSCGTACEVEFLHQSLLGQTIRPRPQ
jgi:hypothetical protein